MLESRTSKVTTAKTDAVVTHLGTNNAASKQTEAQCILRCSDALDNIKAAHQDTPIVLCSVPPTSNRHAAKKVSMLNALFEHTCSRSANMLYLDTGVTLKDIGKDGIHLTDSGKDEVALKIKSALQSFYKRPGLRLT